MDAKVEDVQGKRKEVCCLLTLTYLVCTCQRSFLAGHELTPRYSQGPLNADRVREAYALDCCHLVWSYNILYQHF